MVQDTLIQNLSSAIQATISNFQTPEFVNTATDLLTAAQQLSSLPQLSDLDNLINSLSSVPLHPYQNLLWAHFEPGYKFKTIDEVPEPEKIPVKECIDYVTKKEQEINKTLFHNLTCAPDQQITSIFETLSGDQIVCNFEKQKKYLEFFEMVRQIPIDSITSENCNSLAKKIIAEYIKVI
jgi:hypothetical protein